VARNRRRYGGYLVHLGVVVLFIGLAGSTAFTTTGDLALRTGERGTVGDYTVVNEGSQRSRDEHKGSVAVRLGIFDGERRVATLTPGVNFYFSDEQRSTEVAIDSGPRRDIYVVMAGLWIAGIIIAIGTVIAAWPAPRGRPQEAVVPSRATRAQRA
jgi:cytochrome c-type biogenesis protein CcmF